MSSPARRSLQSFAPTVCARAWTTSRLLVNGSRPAVTRSGAAKGSRPPHWPAIGCNTGGMSEPEGRGAAWTEERGTSDEGRRRLKVPRRRAGRHSAPKGRGAAWTEEQHMSEPEGRGAAWTEERGTSEGATREGGAFR